MRPGGYFFASESSPDCLVVISSFEWAEIEFANVNGLLRVVATTLSALEMRKKRAFIHNQAGKILLSHQEPREFVKSRSLHLRPSCPGPGIGTWSSRTWRNRLPWHRRASPSATLDGMTAKLGDCGRLVNFFFWTILLPEPALHMPAQIVAGKANIGM
jgi:hypothetical protein